MPLREKQIAEFLREHFEEMRIAEFTEDGVLYLELRGECADCPYREFSLESDIREALTTASPEIRRVSVRAGVSEETLHFVKKLLRI